MSQTKDQAEELKSWVVKEGGWLASLIGSVFLFLILFSYHPDDPGINHAVEPGQLVQNYGGVTGAWLTSVLLFVLGVWAFSLPFLLLGVAWRSFHTAKDAVDTADHLLRGTVGLLLMVLSGSALSALFMTPSVFGLTLPHSAGGVIGYAIGQSMVDVLDLLAATLVLLFFFFLSFSLIIGKSWLWIFEQTGSVFWSVWEKVAKQKNKLFKKTGLQPPLSSGSSERPSLQETSKPRPALNIFREKLKKPRTAASPAADSNVQVKTHTQVQAAVFDSENAALPGPDLLDPPPPREAGYSEDMLKAMATLLEKNLADFGVKATVETVQPGPVVTRFEILPAAGVKVSQISSLAKDLARALSVPSVRVVEVIPGKSTVGIEIPNLKRELIALREIITAENFVQAASPLTLALGKDIAGSPVVADLAKMPHLLVAGTTGSGKSVGINSMILSLLYKATPDQVRLIMVDPKMLELSVYEDIPHLLTPVVTDMNDAANALRWCVSEMDRRYQLMAKLGVRNITGFNEKVQAAIDKGAPIVDPLWKPDPNFGHELSEEAPTLTPLPYIVVVIDEFADMIMVVGKKVEELIARLAQKARAAGIHLILATQRPSVNVITGLIKANIPTRISFQVSSKVDSRTILDQMGAEHLLGQGDMLYLPPGTSAPLRVHGAFVSDDEVHRVVEFVKRQGAPQYLDIHAQQGDEGGRAGVIEGGDAEQDSLYDAAVAFVIEKQRVSVSLIQRQFSIGYNRAARIVEAMEKAGVVSALESNGSRKVLVPKEH